MPEGGRCARRGGGRSWHDTGGVVLALLLAASPAAYAGEMFTDQAAATGLDFYYFNGMSGKFFFNENVGAGVALFDYDNDGDLDVYLTQGGMQGEGKGLEDALFAPPAGVSLTDRLFRNDLAVAADGGRVLRFTDVTTQSGIRADGYGMGVATGDYDNDGWVDLYVTNFQANQLWRNNGDGSFSDTTEHARAGEPRWSVSAVFLDYDRDGWLDLFIGNYTDFSLLNRRICYAPNSARDYCSPKLYGALPDRLLRNRGDGSFEDVSETAGISRAFGPALGVIGTDLNGDGWLDLYVGNDAAANQLWINQQDGTFRDEALLSGTAVNMEGVAEASMGVDAGDFDGDGDEDLFMTHLLGETNTLFVNDGHGWFQDRSLASGLAVPSKAYTSFGTAWFDYDNDGWLDLFAANGEVRVVPILAKAGDNYPLHQPNQLFRNRGDGTFEDISARAGAVFSLSEVSRGAAFGDLDNDGDTDIVVGNNNGWARLLRNEVGNASHWLGLRLVAKQGRDAVGARVEIQLDEKRRLWRRVRTGGSYAAANDPRILVGLGQATRVDRVRVYWADGEVEDWSEVPLGRYTSLHQGQGRRVAQ